MILVVGVIEYKYDIYFKLNYFFKGSSVVFGKKLKFNVAYQIIYIWGLKIQI